MEKRIHIAIDGPAGAGKSTIAKNIAERLNILHLDTGAMYRAIGLYAINNNYDSLSESDMQKCITDINVDVKYIDDTQRTYLNGSDVTDKIRTPDVSTAASNVSKWPCVRIKLVELQRLIADKISIVMDGRDIGTYVLPESNYKFYLTASVDERAKRRFNELILQGKNITLEKVKAEIENRDIQDSTRNFAPLHKAEDALEIDTTNLNVQQVMQIVFDRLGFYNESN